MSLSTIEMRDAFITRLYERAKCDKDIVFLCNDYGAPSLDIFRDEMPEQFFNMAISEQNMISTAAGMAMHGKKVFVYSIASFLTLRCLEQIKIDICSMKLPVTLVGVGTAYAYSADGPTHHATEDLAVMRCLAHLSIYSPPDSNTAALLVDIALQQNSPKYFRFDKGKYPLLQRNEFPSTGFSILREGGDICLVATGAMVSRAQDVADKLTHKGMDAMVIDLCRIKPLDDTFSEVLSGRHVLSIEEHAMVGGIGSALAELAVDTGQNFKLKRVAIQEDQLYTYGMRERLHQERGLSTDQLVDKALRWIDAVKLIIPH